jgi:hypothetical protein
MDEMDNGLMAELMFESHQAYLRAVVFPENERQQALRRRVIRERPRGDARVALARWLSVRSPRRARYLTRST